MVNAISAVLPVSGAPGVGADTVLQPGSVIDATVVQVLEANLVRLAIAGLSIDATTQVPLQAGAALSLAVTQTADGLQLAIVPKGPGASPAAATDTSRIATTAPSDPIRPALSPAEAAVVNATARSAALKQAPLSPLFADVAAAVDRLPSPLQAVATALLAARPELSSALSGDTLKSAVQSSGLFLEANLAATGTAPASSLPDLKAALLVFRQTLASWLGEAGTGAAPAGASAGQAMASSAGWAALAGAGPAEKLAASAGASLVPELEAEEAYLPKALLPLAEEISGGAPAAVLTPAARAAAATLALNLLQDAADPAAEPQGHGATAPGSRGAPLATDAPGLRGAVPPPLRGATPVAQPVAPASIAADATPQEIVRRLVSEADGAIARQNLMQIASLPERVDSRGVDPAGARWQFEIPFATPQGTAVAQFEIARDGGGQSAAPAAGERIWRARFSLDVEPAGPVHAQVSLSGGTTSVRMWAERPLTAARLRAGAADLKSALREVSLEPGDVVIGDGAPPQVAAAKAGHFLDRAT